MIRRAALLLAVTVFGGILSYALQDQLKPLRIASAWMIHSLVSISGVSCVRDEASLYFPRSSVSISLVATGLVWWAPAWLIAFTLPRRVSARLAIAVGAVLASFVLSACYEAANILAQVAHKHTFSRVLDCAFGIVVLLLLATLLDYWVSQFLKSNSGDDVGIAPAASTSA